VKKRKIVKKVLISTLEPMDMQRIVILGEIAERAFVCFRGEMHVIQLVANKNGDARSVPDKENPGRLELAARSGIRPLSQGARQPGRGNRPVDA
jgi:hypothetical protein